MSDYILSSKLKLIYCQRNIYSLINIQIYSNIQIFATHWWGQIENVWIIKVNKKLNKDDGFPTKESPLKENAALFGYFPKGGFPANLKVLWHFLLPQQFWNFW